MSDKILDVTMSEERLVKNARRERLAAEARARLVFWLDGEAIALAPRHAPDLWAWGDARAEAITMGRIADVLQAKSRRC